MMFANPPLPAPARGFLAAIVFLGCAGCWTPAVWQGGGGTRVEVMEVIGATAGTGAGEPAGLVIRCEGRGLARGDWYALVPFEEGAAIDAKLEGRWSGLTLGEMERFEAAPKTAATDAAMDRAAAVRRRVRVSRQRPAELIEVKARLEPYGKSHVLLAYWPPGEAGDVPMVVRSAWLDDAAARAYIQRILGDDRAWREYEAHANLVNIVHRPDWAVSRPPHVALLPRTLLRPLPHRAGAAAGAVLLTPLALLGDAAGVVVGVVTAPIWIPVMFIAIDRFTFSELGPEPEPVWHPPLAAPEEAR